VSFTVTVAAAVESVSAPSVFQYAPGAEVTNGGRGTTVPPPALPVAPAAPGRPPAFEPLDPTAPPVPLGAPALLALPVAPALPLLWPSVEPVAPVECPGVPALLLGAPALALAPAAPPGVLPLFPESQANAASTSAKLEIEASSRSCECNLVIVEEPRWTWVSKSRVCRRERTPAADPPWRVRMRVSGAEWLL